MFYHHLQGLHRVVHRPLDESIPVFDAGSCLVLSYGSWKCSAKNYCSLTPAKAVIYEA
jgi:hypothetical protein